LACQRQQFFFPQGFTLQQSLGGKVQGLAVRLQPKGGPFQGRTHHLTHRVISALGRGVSRADLR
jgi:hypothetical protein